MHYARDCPHCGVSFRRREHLARHMARHDGARPYLCPECSKAFSRRDTLKRHVGTHGTAAVADFARDAQPSRHACRACAKAKQRCSGKGPGAEPCTGCRGKGQDCVYDYEEPFAETRASPVVPTPYEDVPASGFAAGRASSRLAQSATLSNFDHATSSSNPQPEDDSATSYGASAVHTNALPAEQDLFSLEGATQWDETAFELSGFSFSLFPSPSHDWTTYEDLRRVAPSTADNYRSQEPCMVEEEDVLLSEHVHHVAAVPVETHSMIVQFARDHLPPSETTQCLLDFPSLAHLDVYVQLYFEHFHPRMPFLHVPSFDTSEHAWRFVLIAATIGCESSMAAGHVKHLEILHRLGQSILDENIRSLIDTDPLSCAQILLMYFNLTMFSGSLQKLVHLQLHRNTLSVLCRKLLSRDGSVLRQPPPVEISTDPWMEWVRLEARRRVIYFTWITECFHELFYMLPPLLSLVELQVPLPCSEQLWHSNGRQWLSLHRGELHAPDGQHHGIPAPSVCSVLAQALSGRIDVDNICESARLAVLLAASSQFVSMRDLDDNLQTPGRSSPFCMAANLLQSSMDGIIRSLLGQDTTNRSEPCNVAGDCATLARVAAIVSFTPSKYLSPFNHWQTTPHGSDNARKQLQLIMSQNPARARECAYHAGQLFEHFRKQANLKHIDPLCLLMATLYLLAFIELCVLPPPTPVSSASSYDKGEVVRIDRPLDSIERADWIERGGWKRPHITGIGTLDAARSSLRLIKASARIMGEGASKSRLAATLARMFTAQTMGKAPAFDAID